MRTAALIAVLTLSQAASAGPPEFILPVACELGTTCFIQNYVDTDPSEGYQDFSCGALSYDGHKGTDFAVATHLDALTGVEVLAAAPGTVKGVRDGLADHFLGGTPDFPEGQDCGNGLVIDHGNGWESQYCHLKQGSITVTRGAQVDAGAILGRIGMSGRTEFPHLHLSLRHERAVIDPFDPEPDSTCGAPEEAQLWATPLAYGAGGLLEAGFSFGVPDFNLVKFGKAHARRISAEQGALVLWAYLYGTREGDELVMAITGPSGQFFEHREVLERTQAQAMRAAGRKLHAENTLEGAYSGEVILMREGRELGRLSTSTVLRE